MRPFIMALLLLSGCDLFTPREPELPVEPSASFKPPTEPGIVLTNMANAFKERNTLNYIASFADSADGGERYQFRATPQAEARFQSFFDSWNKRAEQQYFENIRSRLVPGLFPSLAFTRIQAVAVYSDSAHYDLDYRLTIPHTLTGVPTVSEGKTRFEMVAGPSGLWSILRWIEIPAAVDTFSWSFVKGTFAQ